MENKTAGTTHALKNRDDAYLLLRDLGATERLLLHSRLVGEAADELMRAYGEFGIEFDTTLVTLGAALHDAGKILHPEELDGPGSMHEAAGERLLLAHGVPPEVARCCVLHGVWQGSDVPLEGRTVALADRLWKGTRGGALELAIVDDIASRLGVGRWDLFVKFDCVFEQIAAGGPERLQRSRGGQR